MLKARDGAFYWASPAQLPVGAARGGRGAHRLRAAIRSWAWRMPCSARGVQVHPFRVDELHLRDAHQAEHGLEVGVTASVVCP